MQNDQGEARNIIIRGLAPSLNSVTLNGARIPSAEGDNRKVQMDRFPADMIQYVFANKRTTPDLDADAIGGYMNTITHSTPNDQLHPAMIRCGYKLINQKKAENTPIR